MQDDRLEAARVQACLSKPVRSSELYDALLLTPGRGRAEPEGGPLPAARDRGACVLVVEDNQVNQIVATGLLERLGYEVDLAEDGRAALAALASRPYAAVLMDCHMPEMDGYTTTTELRRREGAGRRTPVIAMTAGVLAEDRERCRAAGMDDFVSKPVDAALLGRTMARWVTTGGPQAPAQAPPVTPADPEVLDGARLEMLRTLGADDGWGMLPAVVEAFLRAAPDHAAAVRSAHAAVDAGAMEAVLHRLLGSAANLGATRLAGTCADLGDRVRAGEVLEPPAVASLDAELTAACGALADRLPTRA
jgi:CheY-like chemotaxis protein/HPt (histidine-containing phosphotransfer) domain-containing protein